MRTQIIFLSCSLLQCAHTDTQNILIFNKQWSTHATKKKQIKPNEWIKRKKKKNNFWLFLWRWQRWWCGGRRRCCCCRKTKTQQRWHVVVLETKYENMCHAHPHSDRQRQAGSRWLYSSTQIHPHQRRLSARFSMSNEVTKARGEKSKKKLAVKRGCVSADDSWVRVWVWVVYGNRRLHGNNSIKHSVVRATCTNCATQIGYVTLAACSVLWSK